MTAFYNEIDPYAAQWLRNLIAAGHIAPGIVDERPIQEIEPWELAGFTQCHFFAGIGIWSHALRRAGWSDDQPIWTGSCPCQPFSNAGQRKGISDDRHLWPYWFNIIRECKPSIVVGEQVASKDGLGWFDLVSADMEGANYAVGASDLCAAGFRQAHIRQRLYFIAVAHHHPRLEGWAGGIECGNQRLIGAGGLVERVAEPEHDGRRIDQPGRRSDQRIAFGRGSEIGAAIGLANPDLSGEHGRSPGGEQPIRRVDYESGARAIRNPGEIDERWLALDWLLCRNPAGEPSWRPVEPGAFPLAHGIAARMDKLRAYGNGLDDETATQFCEVVKEIADGV